VRYFAAKGMQIAGLDNDMRKYFFGPEASTEWMARQLSAALPNYRHHAIDIRDREAVFDIFRRLGRNISLVIHTAAQPSHDWAAREPFTDFTINANGTHNLLEATRQFSPDAVFIFTSTNKVYGDAPNSLPLVEKETRWEVEESHPFAARGIGETMSIDHSMHSLFGASKVAADVMTQEYGRYFGLRTSCFRAGCLTGPNHSGAQLHGFLAYLMRCAMTGTEYKVFGYKGKQVRDNLHSSDLVRAFDAVFAAPRCGEVYNIGGSRFSNCSMLEAIALCEQIAGRKLSWQYVEENRAGDHMWWISDISRFQSHYPSFRLQYDVPAILREMHARNAERWLAPTRTTHA
jgi:CDP-paratose 2-epimerase